MSTLITLAALLFGAQLAVNVLLAFGVVILAPIVKVMEWANNS